jgi:hypothetical protein
LYYAIYKTINLINGKEYVGFHGIKNLQDLKYEKSKNGSIFEDGYLGSGKLMKQALEKYGPLNMSQELLLITNDKEEAEELEREIVCIEWVESENNYNISLGGNVTILFGVNNGFYGKKHTSVSIQKIQEARKIAYENQPFSWSKSYLVDDENVVFYNSNEICSYFNIENWYEINRLFYENKIKYSSEYLQQAAINRYRKRHDFLNDTEARLEAKNKLAQLASERFKGIPKTEESNLKRGEAISKWISENPEKHSLRMEKINKNPEKIKKSADKHRGMKRSEETKKNISESLKGKTAFSKDKIYIMNPSTKERKLIEKMDVIPEGWMKGMKLPK